MLVCCSAIRRWADGECCAHYLLLMRYASAIAASAVHGRHYAMSLMLIARLPMLRHYAIDAELTATPLYAAVRLRAFFTHMIFLPLWLLRFTLMRRARYAIAIIISLRVITLYGDMMLLYLIVTRHASHLAALRAAAAAIHR